MGVPVLIAGHEQRDLAWIEPACGALQEASASGRACVRGIFDRRGFGGLPGSASSTRSCRAADRKAH